MTHRVVALCIAFAISAPACLGQALTVRVIDAKSLKPVKGRTVRVQFEDISPLRWRGGYVDKVTNKEGKAVFQLPAPLPDHVVVAHQIPNWRQCSPPQYDTRQVLRSGVVGEDACMYADLEFTAKPGEIVIFVRYVSFWERLRSFPV